MTTKNQFPPSPVSKSSSADAPARPPRKHKIGLIILKIFLALVVVFLVLVMYLQTSNAFRLVWLPMIGSKVDGKLTAGGGAISLLGNLQIDDLKFESNSKAQAADVDSIRVSVAPLSLIFGSAPRIKNAEITNARVVTESFSSSPAAKGPKSTSPQKDIDVKNPKPVSQGPLLPVQVERLRVKNFSLEARTDGRKDVRIEKLNLDLDGLSPGMKGPCKINADFAVAPDEPSRARSGTLALSLDVDLNADGSALNYSGTSLLAVQDGPPKEGGGVTADLKFECKTIQGSWDQSGSVRSVILATAETPKEQAGSFKLDLAWDRTKETIKSEVEWAGINRELLNPVLAALGPAQFESAQLDGLITVENSSTGYAFQSSIKGKNLSLRADANQKPTPPLDFTSLQKGSWNSKSDEITLAQADIKLERQGKTIGTVGLDQTLTMKRAGASEAGTAAADNLPKEAHLNVEISDLEAENLRPWLAIFDSHALDSVREGKLQGKLVAGVTDSGNRLEVIGTLSAVGLTLQDKDEKSPRGPFQIDNKISASIEKLNALTIKPTTITVSQSGKELARTELTGQLDIERGKTHLQADLNSGDLGHLLDTLGLSKADQQIIMEQGTLAGGITLDRPSKKEAFAFSAVSNLKSLSLVSGGRGKLERSFACDIKASADSDNRFLTVDQFKLTCLESSGGAAGEITAQGIWPIRYYDPSDPGAKKANGGKAAIKIAGLKTGPWIRLFDWVKDEDLGDVPLNAEINITVDPTGEDWVFDGEEKIGPVKLASGENAPEEISMTISNRFQKVGEDIKSFAVDLTAPRRDHPQDKVMIEGSAHLGDRPKVIADVHVDSLSADAYADRVAEQKKKRVGADAPEDQTNESASPAPSPPDKEDKNLLPADLDLTLNVDQFLWRDINGKQIKGKLTSDARNLRAVIETMKINDGTMTANLGITQSGADRILAWEAGGEGLDVGAVTRSFDPGLKDKIEGRAKFVSKGNGVQKQGKANPDLDGSLTFDLTDGQMKNSRLLDEIGKATGTDFFDKMVFSGFHGDIVFDRKWANLKNVVVNGNATRLYATGRVGIDGELDLEVQPAIGPELKEKMPEKNKLVGYLGAVVGEATQFLVFPLVITVKGPSDEPHYGVKPKLPSGAEDAVGDLSKSVKEILKGGGEKGGSLMDGVGGKLKNLKKSLLSK